MAIAGARQATPSAVGIGRTNSRMEVSQGLDGFQLGHERPEDGQTTIKPIWRQIMAETNQHGRASKQRKHSRQKTPPPRGEAVFCSIMTRKEDCFVLGRPGSDLLSQGLSHSTIGAEEFNGRVRDGIGFKLLARTTRPAKDKDTKQARSRSDRAQSSGETRGPRSANAAGGLCRGIAGSPSADTRF